MATIRGYMGVSLDHYIAAPDGGLDWLTKYETADFGAYGYAHFIKAIRTVVMGRATYDWLVASGAGWPYGEQRVIVSDIPGTTRDAIDTSFEWAGRTVRLVDTAGDWGSLGQDDHAVLDDV